MLEYQLLKYASHVFESMKPVTRINMRLLNVTQGLTLDVNVVREKNEGKDYLVSCDDWGK